MSRLRVMRPAVADYPPRARFGPRRTGDFELVWLVSGSARWRDLDRDRVLDLVPGMVLLISPGTRDEFHWDPVTPCRHGYVHFTPLAPAITLAEEPRLCPAGPTGPVAALLDYLLWLGVAASPAWRRRVEQVVSLVVDLIESGPLPDPIPTPEPPCVTAALAHVRATWSTGMRAVSLTELARAASVSKAHLARQFQRTFGVGAVTALEQVRLARAATLLLRSNLSVTEISSVCGFPDPLHFSRRFRHMYGRAPRAYRAAGGQPSSRITAGVLRLGHRLRLPDEL